LTYIFLVLREAFRIISYQFGAFLGSVLTIFLAMLTAGSFAIIIKNTSLTLDKFRNEASLEIYLESEIDSLTKENIRDALVANKYVLQVKFINKDMALFRLRETFGQQMVAGLKTNPLPESYEVTLESFVYENSNFEELVDSLFKLPGVEDIGYVTSAISRLKIVFKAATFLGIVLGIMVILATGFIVGNTIRVRIAEWRQTFYIMRLVGASNSFIYTPYLLTGSLMGFLGSALSIATLKLGTFYFSMQVAPVCFLDFPESISFVIAGGLIGFTGSYLALKRFLSV